MAIVLDKSYGNRLLALAQGSNIWACDTNENRTAIERLWADRSSYDPCLEFTLFDFDSDATPESNFLDVILTVDEHHADWNELRVIGVDPTPAIVEMLIEIDVTKIDRTQAGFLGLRMVR